LLDGGIGRLLRVPYDANTERAGMPRPLDLRGDASLFNSDPRLSGTLVLLGSWTSAYKIYAYDSATAQSSDTQLQPVGPHDNFNSVEAEEVKVPSHDGVLVPLSIAHPKGM